MRSLITVAVCAVLSAGVLLASASAADEPEPQPPRCSLLLDVELDPDVPNATDPGFLSSLVGNHASYSLVLIQVVDDSNVQLRLDGPGSAENCLEVVDSMRRDARVESIDIR